MENMPLKNKYCNWKKKTKNKFHFTKVVFQILKLKKIKVGQQIDASDSSSSLPQQLIFH